MAETIVDHSGVAKWHWYSVMSDLEEQGGLKDVVIDPLSVEGCRCGGNLNGNPFYITWVHNKFLLVTMKTFSQQLADAFAKVVEYKPFCRYDRDGMVTIEWDKVNTSARFEELKKDSGVHNLRKM